MSEITLRTEVWEAFSQHCTDNHVDPILTVEVLLCAHLGAGLVPQLVTPEACNALETLLVAYHGMLNRLRRVGNIA